MGRKNGVAAKLRANVGHLVAVHCIAHQLELGVSKAIKGHPHLQRLNDVLVFLYEQYHYSPKALRELRMLREALEKVLKPTNLVLGLGLALHPSQFIILVSRPKSCM